MACEGCNKGNTMPCDKTYAGCVSYESTLPDWSKNKTNKCVTLDDTNIEIYEELTKLRDNENLTIPVCDKITYVKETDGKVTQKNAILKHGELLCNLLNQESSKIDEIFNYNIVGKIDVKCLTLSDGCGNSKNITTFGDLIQALVNKACP
jgi:hypothetical protein